MNAHQRRTAARKRVRDLQWARNMRERFRAVSQHRLFAWWQCRQPSNTETHNDR